MSKPRTTTTKKKTVTEKNVSGVTVGEAIELGREIVGVLRLKYPVGNGVAGMMAALALCCARSELEDGATRDGSLAAVHEGIDQCFLFLQLQATKK